MRRLLVLLLLGAATAGTPAALAVDNPAAAERQAPRALFFGDSYFVGGGCSPDREQDMAWLAGVELGYRPVVRGAGGTGFVAGNTDYGIKPYLAQIRDGALDARHPHLVVIEGGTNDVGQPLDRVRRNATKVLRIAQRKYPRALVVLVGPMDTLGGYDDTDPVKDTLRTVARKLDLPFVNPQKWTAGRDDLLCDDYVHPTYQGHVYLGHRLAAALDKRGAGH
jgi:acyl-CoA thioesterase I